MPTSAIEKVPFRPFAVALPLSVATMICLYAIVIGYAVFILPVFANLAAHWNASLTPSGPDYPLLALWTMRATVVVFLGWMFYARRLPREQHPRHIVAAIGTVNVMLGVSGLMLGVSLVQFVLIVIRASR